ncbi:hypothetical protein FGB62_581g00 [Gracilaria domingensis]|nr:hypothetical protein FGB62_581g00 [Gracilaria domingensis]
MCGRANGSGEATSAALGQTVCEAMSELTPEGPAQVSREHKERRKGCGLGREQSESAELERRREDRKSERGQKDWGWGFTIEERVKFGVWPRTPEAAQMCRSALGLGGV